MNTLLLSNGTRIVDINNRNLLHFQTNNEWELCSVTVTWSSALHNSVGGSSILFTVYINIDLAGAFQSFFINLLFPYVKFNAPARSSD